MQIAYELLHILKDGKFHSGTQLAEQCRVSRSYIWKACDFLRKLSLPIQSVKGKGYRWYHPLELLDKEIITEQLSSSAKQAISALDIVNMIPSTNDYLLSRVHYGIRRGAVCCAESQSAGKGRAGRKWHSPFASNIYFSLYWRFEIPMAQLSGLSLAIALGVLEALSEWGPLPEGVGIKWPNDFYFNQSKFGGILIEAHRDQGVVIGIGLNFHTSGKIDDQPVTNLGDIFSKPLSRNLVLAKCLNKLVEVFSEFERQGLAPFMSAWKQYDSLYGKEIDLILPQGNEHGVAQGINERGELLVKVQGALRAIRSGDIRIRFG